MVRIPFIILVLCSGFFSLFSTGSQEFIIVLDAGHGGEDPGCLGPSGTQEKDITLAFALELEKIINDSISGVRVVQTRTNDTFVSLYSRADLANKIKASLFISIHCNSACRIKGGKMECNREARGMEIYALGLHRTKQNLEVAMRENSVILMEKNYQIQYENFDPNNEEHYIILSLRQNLYLASSLHLGDLILAKCNANGIVTRGLRQAGFWVLYKTSMPSILIELDYLTSPDGEKLLTDPSYRRKIAISIVQALKEYIQTIVSDNKTHADKNKVSETGENDISQSPFKTIPQEGLFYAVQIIATLNRVSSPLNLGISDSSLYEFSVNGIYKYLYGMVESYGEAVSLRDKLREAGYEDAFIVGINNGRVVPASEVRALQNNNQTKNPSSKKSTNKNQKNTKKKK